MSFAPTTTRAARNRSLTSRVPNIPLRGAELDASANPSATLHALHSQLAALRTKLAAQSDAAHALERSALAYYYTHTISFETNDAVGGGWHAYYHNSLWSRTEAAAQTAAQREAKERQTAQTRAERVERALSESARCGPLWAVWQHVSKAEAALSATAQQIEAMEAKRREWAARKAAAERALGDAQAEMERCAARRASCAAHEGQQAEAETAAKTALEAERKAWEEAQAELQRRETAVCALRSAVERLTRKRRQRE